jgi:DNA invertase Pin-like site-specific DNA recombinase
MNIGYARVSTLDQNLDVQMQAVRKEGSKRIFREKISGTSRERPEFQRMLDQLRNGDTELNPEQAKLARWLIDEGRSVREIADTFRRSHCNYLSALSSQRLNELGRAATYSQLCVMLAVASCDKPRTGSRGTRHNETNAALPH